MPVVLCGLPCFDAPSLSTAGAAAREFVASLNPALEGPNCAVEVYRLERLAPEAELSAEDTVVCHVPGWRFDFAALEELHRQLEDLRHENETLQTQYSRTKEVLISLNSAVEAAEVVESQQRRSDRGRDSQREVSQLKEQLAQSDRRNQDTKATVIALRKEFMQLVSMMADAEGPWRSSSANTTPGGAQNPHGLESPLAMKENVRSSPHEIDSKFDFGTDFSKPPRHVSQPPTAMVGVRQPTGPPYAIRGGHGGGATSAMPTSRPGARPRGTHQRGVHSAGASNRQRVHQSEGG